jgi:uncharacterized repeat protein (TIGR03803 family)
MPSLMKTKRSLCGATATIHQPPARRTPRHFLGGFTRLAVVAALGWCAAIPPAAAQFTVLHNFAGYPHDGSEPYGSLALAGPNLYGMTPDAGSNGWGVLFEVNTNGTGYTLLHVFSGESDGGQPWGSLTLSPNGSTFYGMASSGGVNSGVLLSISTNGAGFSVYDFSAFDNGAEPIGSVILSGSTLYGMTEGGGTNFPLDGTVFSINTNFSAATFSLLHTFGNGGDGDMPEGDVALAGSTLYGMSRNGTNSTPLGVVFSVSTTGSGFVPIHTFTGSSNDGADPIYGAPIVSGGVLYGMTQSGGTGFGVVFRMNTDGSGYTNLHSFVGAASGDGANPKGQLILSGGVLYGMTASGGTNTSNCGGSSFGCGTMFQINTNGTGYTILHTFNGGYLEEGPYTLNDGSLPEGGLLLAGNTLYGMTSAGGTNSCGCGTVFSLVLTNQAPVSPVLTEVLAVQVAGTNVVITLPSVANQVYQLQYTSAMMPTNWINTGGTMTGTGSPIQLIDVNGAVQTQRFYQIVISP